MGTLASYEHANAHLDETKIKFESDVDAADEASDAYDEIAAYIGTFWPEQILLWDWSPDPGQLETPQVVRYIASLLMAGFRYERKYSEEDLGPNDYAERLKNRAYEKLEGLVDGSVTLWDTDYAGDVGVEQLEQADFFPNDTYTPELVEFEKELDQNLQPKRAFGMDRVF